MTAPLFPSRPRLRLVASSPRPRRIEVRTNATEVRYPYGQSRAFHLTHDELDELIAVAMRMERRS
jgi:hypothetical protein